MSAADTGPDLSPVAQENLARVQAAWTRIGNDLTTWILENSVRDEVVEALLDALREVFHLCAASNGRLNEAAEN